jgi:hypothetical protein
MREATVIATHIDTRQSFFALSTVVTHSATNGHREHIRIRQHNSRSSHDTNQNWTRLVYMQLSFDVERLLSATPERALGKKHAAERMLLKGGVHLSGCPAPRAIPSLTPVENSPFDHCKCNVPAVSSRACLGKSIMIFPIQNKCVLSAVYCETHNNCLKTAETSAIRVS